MSIKWNREWNRTLALFAGRFLNGNSFPLKQLGSLLRRENTTMLMMKQKKKRVVNTIPGRGSNLFDLFSGKFIIFLHQRAYRKIMVLLERKWIVILSLLNALGLVELACCYSSDVRIGAFVMFWSVNPTCPRSSFRVLMFMCVFGRIVILIKGVECSFCCYCFWAGEKESFDWNVMMVELSQNLKATLWLLIGIFYNYYYYYFHIYRPETWSSGIKLITPKRIIFIVWWLKGGDSTSMNAWMARGT